MKKITSLLMILFSILGFSQDENRGKIQTYLNENKEKFNLTTQDISDWFVESTGNSESMKIDTYWIKQRYQGVEIYNTLSNAWIKNDEVINVVNGFIPNISQKVNTTTPTLPVLNALHKAFIAVNATDINGQIIETISEREFKISNGNLNENPIAAKLVFQPVGETLRLAWDFNFYTQDQNHLWSIRIDAVSGTLLEKNDMVISCNFGSHNSSKDNFYFYRKFFKETTANTLTQVQGGSYRVIPFNYESPNHHSRDLITNPENATASPKGWHDTNTLTGTTASLKYTYLRGNNVWARADYGNTDPTSHSTTSTTSGYSPSSSGLSFDYTYPGTSVAANTYINAATTNLFYMNNVLHDLWYKYGFNEPNGNFQQTNYLTGGTATDAVWADAQDGSSLATPTLNNANFSAPADNSSIDNNPRMQMYLWSYRKAVQLLTINSPLDIAGSKNTSDNGFNPGHVNVPVAPGMIQSDIILFDDGTPDVGQTDNADGCTAALNATAINEHITIIRRSTSTDNGGNPCTFIQKALNAKAAGATALIIVNNDDTYPDLSIGMSGADANVTIPVISVSLNNGEAIITKLKNGETVNAKIQSPIQLDLFVNTDGDLDNGVIAHEYGHGISIRLTGGRNNSSCLSNPEQMGEGWSDWFALMLTMKPGDVGTTPRGMATFVINEDPNGEGLRNYPYSTDMSINPETFGYTNGGSYPKFPVIVQDSNGLNYVEPHNVGEIWATILWDLTWAYINKYGYDDNKYTGTGGNNKVMRLIIDAIKSQPCSPSFIEARNAILAADLLTTNGQDYCLIWEVFARRGMGVNASSGFNSGNRYDTDSIIDQVEDFTIPTPGSTPATGSNCTLSVNYFETQDLFRVYPNPTNGMLNIRINSYVGKVNIQVIDINGRIVSEFKNEDFNIEKSLNLNNLQTGMYVIKVSGDSLNFTQKIMKN